MQMPWTTGLIPAHAGKTAVNDGQLVGGPAHPRSRGENWCGESTLMLSVGSSPLTRGKLHSIPLHLLDVGLIPAHAGKTALLRHRRDCDWAHPRSRGENDKGPTPVARPSGSSPLTRGKLGCMSCRISCGGLIPAHAGKTRTRCQVQSQHPAHPRSRGENVFMMVVVATDTGSSPLTRGKQGIKREVTRLHRLIPAHAGKTGRRAAGCPMPRAHPRSRGENRTV